MSSEADPQPDVESGPDGARDQAAAPEEEKRVGWAELFFDLVFVFAVTQVSALIESDHTGVGLLRALIVFVPLYWMWVGAAVRTNQADADRPSVRGMLFVIALASVVMTAVVPDAFGEGAVAFALAYWVGRAVLAAEPVRRTFRGERLLANPPVVSLVLTGPLLLAGALVGGVAQAVLWALAAVADLASPTVLRRQMRRMHLNPAHLAERFGLFVLIALGESVVAIGASAGEHLGAVTVVAIALSFALACGLWWVYFHFSHAAVRHALEAAAVQLDIVRLVLSYGHLLFIAAIVAISVGLHEAVAHPLESLHWSGSGLLVGGTALFLAGFGFTRWAMFRLVSRTRLTAAAVTVLILPVGAHLPALVTLLALVVVVAALNVIELRINHREGWRARAAPSAQATRSNTAASP